MVFVYRFFRRLIRRKNIQLLRLFNIIPDRISLLILKKSLIIPCEL